jgi:formate hydrogenlyase subunit 4
MTWVTAAAQALLLALMAPVVVGVTKAVRARLQGRAGGRVAQPWRDLRKLLRGSSSSPRRRC